MTSIFYTILKLSITASYIAAAAILFRIILRKAPKVFRLVLWALVAVRLVVPVSFQSVFSVLPANETHTPTVINNTLHELSHDDYAYENDESFGHTAKTVTENRPSYNNYSTEKVPWKTLSLSTILSAVWIIGIAAMLIYAVVSYIALYRMTAERIPYRDNIYYCEKIKSPFILGIIKPKIFLPSSLSDTDRENVLLHENMHIRHLDHLIKPFAFLLLSVYWFNPVMWLSYILLCCDIELLCDERVIRKMGNDIKKSYSESLVNLAMDRKRISACPLAFGEASTKKRVKNVLKYKKAAVIISVCAAVVCIGLAIVLLTVPKIKSNDVGKSDAVLSDEAKSEGNELKDRLTISESSKSDLISTEYSEAVYKVDDEFVYNNWLNQKSLLYRTENGILAVGCPNGTLQIGHLEQTLFYGINQNAWYNNVESDVIKYTEEFADKLNSKKAYLYRETSDSIFRYLFANYTDKTALILVIDIQHDRNDLTYAALLSPINKKLPELDLDKVYEISSEGRLLFLKENGVTLPTDEYFSTFYHEYDTSYYYDAVETCNNKMYYTLYYSDKGFYPNDMVMSTIVSKIQKTVCDYYGIHYEHTGNYTKLGEGYLYKNHPDKLLEIGVIQLNNICYQLVVKDEGEIVSCFGLDETHGGEDSYYLYNDNMLFEYDPYAVCGFGYFSYALFQLDDNGYMVPADIKNPMPMQYIEFKFDEYDDTDEEKNFPEVKAFLSDAKKLMDKSKLLFTTCEAIKRGWMY